MRASTAAPPSARIVRMDAASAATTAGAMPLNSDVACNKLRLIVNLSSLWSPLSLALWHLFWRQLKFIVMYGLHGDALVIKFDTVGVAIILPISWLSLGNIKAALTANDDNIRLRITSRTPFSTSLFRVS